MWLSDLEKLTDDIEVLVEAENFEKVMRDSCTAETTDWTFHNKNYSTFNRLRIRAEIRLGNYKNEN